MITAEPVPYVTPHLDHDGSITLIRGKWRCTGCGHRLTVLGVPPIETRRQPWRAPAELIDRYRAIHL